MPTRQQRHDIRDAMAQIESLDLAHETSETLRTRLSIIEGKLQVAGANLAGNLFLDFLALQRAVNGYISERSLTPQQESAVELPRAPLRISLFQEEIMSVCPATQRFISFWKKIL